MSVVEETEAALSAASHLTALDKGAVAALRVLARKIDTESELRELALEHAAERKEKPPPVDNVSIPTYLKFCESLGLTPAGRARLTQKKPAAADETAGAIARLRSIHGGRG